MNAALLTVGDELLAGDIENTNATWIARQLADRGVTLARIAVVPDDVAVIAEYVRSFSEGFDAVVVTGGLGGTPDDLTMDGVAAAFDRPLVVNETAREDIERTVEAVRDEYPDLDLDVERHASIPEGSRPLLNTDGLSPGCVAENVYVIPGIPREMKAMFAGFADDFAGNRVTRTFETSMVEGEVTPTLQDAREELPDVALGSYPSRGEEPNRIKVTGEDEAALDAAEAWLREHVRILGEVEDGNRTA
ncbi:competence/damage-inducible protein A [Halomarina oriensis]|uniref:Competence/damage-inducible protein A n=1 Tax=Halomarina oriensis TaxID=671145 RepID=A0A6B0GS59_9EURY|nr:molybdopterin-binding protein [Halomarina oriensis]MWG34508.1 competence/damage-inducible protein A [Halomarina oriensis]